MKCPACQGEMQPGHLTSGGDRIDWIEKNTPFFKRLLAGSRLSSDFFGKTKGFRCDRCAILIIPYGQPQESGNAEQ
jgi:hypothetical protein